MTRNSFNLLILVCLLIATSAVIGQDENYKENKSYFVKSQISDAEKLKVFNNLWETVNRLYFDATFNNHDWAKIRTIYEPQVLAANDKITLKRVLTSMVNELHTSHLVISFEINMSGKALGKLFGDHIDYKNNNIIFGYGYTTADYDGKIVVTSVQANSSAAQLGVKPGWIVNSCEARPVAKRIGENLIFSETSDCIFSTETGPQKKLTLAQSWLLSPRAVTLRESRILPENILYLKFNEFDKGAGQWLTRQVEDSLPAKALIIDLRDNYGGLIDEVRESLSAFFPAQTVIGEFIERDSDVKTFRVGSNNPYAGKVFILTSGSTYSGTEIFAAAFRESGRGKIIGQRSGGFVLNALNKSLSNGFTLQIAFRDYQTVRGSRLEGQGVRPDIEIPFSIND